MKERIKSAIQVFLMLGISMALISIMYVFEGKANDDKFKNIPDLKPPEPQFFSLPAKEGLKEALAFYDIQHPDIVYAQAILETGHFRSQGCLRDNNLFGLYNSKKRQYHKFDHWSVSVVKYKEWIQRRYKPSEDYYKFLQRIGYASDPNYVNKLRNIVKNESRRSKGVSLEKDTTVTRK